MIDLTDLLDRVYTKWGIFAFEKIKKEKMALLGCLVEEVARRSVNLNTTSHLALLHII